ncbi:MAG: ArsA family ATPase [Bacteroidales bacterium]|nr:ArsA family ATPase [Bacteroidales bacterium]
MQNIKFFIGKGGVGKSTISALSALCYSKNKIKTLLVSMDPAHNQQEIFDMEFSEKPVYLSENLGIIETDIDFWIKKYLKESEQKLQNNYNYHSAFSLKNYFKVLKFSPSVEEYAMLLSFLNVLKKHSEKDLIIFDMPPTALSLRFFSLPGVSLKWIYHLKELRIAIQNKKEIISKVKFGKREIEQDKVINQLIKLENDYIEIFNYFKNSDINIVLNNENLSVKESKRIIDKLSDIDLKINSIFINKSDTKIDYFADIQQITVPFSSKTLIGKNNLEEFLEQNNLINF